MLPLELAQRYMDVFYGGGEVDELKPILADDLVFEGPFHRSETAEAYLASLRAGPPEGMRYELLAAYEDATSACLVYRFVKGGIATPMAQRFEVRDGRIARILLVFDTAPFANDE